MCRILSDFKLDGISKEKINITYSVFNINYVYTYIPTKKIDAIRISVFRDVKKIWKYNYTKWRPEVELYV